MVNVVIHNNSTGNAFLKLQQDASKPPTAAGSHSLQTRPGPSAQRAFVCHAENISHHGCTGVQGQNLYDSFSEPCQCNGKAPER